MKIIRATRQFIEYLRRPPGTRALCIQSFAYLACLVMFSIRRATLGADVLDVRFLGYTSDEVTTLFAALEENGQLSTYITSQLTLDFFVFPVIYALFFATLISRLLSYDSTPKLLAILLSPFAVLVLDWLENLAIVSLGFAFDGGVSPTMTLVASTLTVLKSVAFAGVGVLMIWLLVLRLLRAGVPTPSNHSRLEQIRLRLEPVRWEALLILWAILGVVVAKHVLVAGLLLLLIWALFLHSTKFYLFQYVYFLRFPIIATVLLVAFPFLATGAAASLLGNLFVLNFPAQFFLVSFTVTIFAMTILAALRLIYLTAAARGEIAFSRDLHNRIDKNLPREKRLEKYGDANRDILGVGDSKAHLTPLQRLTAYLVRYRWPCFGLLALPFLVIVYTTSGASGWVVILLLLAGWIFAVLLAYAARSIARHWSREVSSDYLAKGAIGYGGQGHWAAWIWIGGVLLLYGALGWYFSPWNSRSLVDWLPAICYVLLVLTLVTLLTSIISLFFDKHRLPVVIAMFVALFIAFYVADADHRYEVLPKPAGWSELPTAPEVIEAWNGRQSESAPKPIVLVAASGGGIKAALWTSRVLEKMVEARQSLPGSVVLVSSTSGGSVGAMYFQESFAEDSTPDLDDMIRATEASGCSSLSASIWGLAYPDLWRILSGGAVPRGDWSKFDRGWALERRWEERRRKLVEIQLLRQADLQGAESEGSLCDLGLGVDRRWTKRRARLSEAGLISAETGSTRLTPRTISDWVGGVKAGWRPAQVFNATVAESGAPMRIATVDLGRTSAAAPGSKPQEFADLYPWADIEVAAAARLSATFPWVSPITRPWMREQHHGPLIEALRCVPAPDSETCDAIDRFERLNAAAAFRLADGGYYDNFGIDSTVEFLQDVGPVALKGQNVDRVLIVEIRASDEKESKETGGGLTYSLFGPISIMEKVRTASQIARNDRLLGLLRDDWAHHGVDLCRVVFTLKQPGPLSWQLSDKEVKAVRDAWGSDGEDDKMLRVGEFLDGDWSPDVARPSSVCPTWHM